MASRYLCAVFLAFAFWLPVAQAAVVPNVAGQTQAAATRTLANARLAVGSVTRQASPTVPAGQVISLSPAAGTNVNDGAWVDLVVSTGPPAGSAPTPGTVRPSPAPSPTASAPAPGSIHVSIKNDYIASLNFGVLGKGQRDGIDTAEGVLEFDAARARYDGTVTASVFSTQTLAGLGGIGSCSGRYRDSQQLQVIGRQVGGFNPLVQTVTPATIAAQTTEYLILEFVPKPGAELPANPNPDQDEVINCHTIIETEAGRFIPLNDSRWTISDPDRHSMGYIIALPSSGTINYTDNAVNPATGPLTIGPFKVDESVWTIEVRRLR